MKFLSVSSTFISVEPVIKLQMPAPKPDLSPILDDSNATCLQLPNRTECYFLTVHYSTVSFRSVQFDVSIQTSNCSSLSMFMSVNEDKTLWKKCEETNPPNESDLMCSLICPCYEKKIKVNCNSFKLDVVTDIAICGIKPVKHSFV